MADHVQRVVEGLGELLARIAVGRKAGRLAEAEKELAELAARVAGLDMNLLAMMGAKPLAVHLTDRRQHAALAAICEERAEVEAARGDAAGASAWRANAAEFRSRA